jgi:hypothetical protein
MPKPSSDNDSSVVRQGREEAQHVQADERKEKNNHGVDVNLEKDLR